LRPFANRLSAVVLALALACACLPLGAARSQDQTADAARDQATYQARFAAMMGGGDYYDPLESVPGPPAYAPLPTAARPNIAPEALAAARDYAHANNSTALLVWRDGAVQEADYFKGATATTALVSKSLSKPMTAIVVGRAIALGYIKSLDQPVSDFIPRWRGGPKAAITIRYLLDMRSGLLGQRSASDPADILNRAYLDPHHDRILLDDYPLTSQPGTRFDYANAVADLIAPVIERATGMRYAQFVSREVLKPLGAAGGSVWIDRPGGLAHSACCMMLPAETWLRLAILLIDDGRWNGARLLPAGYVDQMRQPTPQNPYYGLGIYVTGAYVQRRGFGNPDTPGPRVLHGEPYLASDLYLFDGNGDQVVYIVPSERLIIARLGDPPPRAPEWDNAVLPNLILNGIQRRAPGWTPQPR
jgi:CubicO group peptidase (beta-lactamase class C family)